MTKIWAIVWKELYTTFTDRNLVLIMIGSPLVLSTIVAFAFGGLAGGDVPIENVPIAVVNHDQPGATGIAYGDVFVSVLVPEGGSGSSPGDDLSSCELAEDASPGSDAVTIEQLTEAVLFDRAAADALVESGEVDFTHSVPDAQAYTTGVARAAVDSGVYTAAIIIPSDFTERMSYVPVSHPELEQTGVVVYANSGSPIAAGVVRSIAGAITNQIATGNITIAATFDELQATAGLAALAGASQDDLGAAFACAFTPAGSTVRLEAETVEGESQGNATRFILVQVGSAQAMFFALFTAQFGVLGLHNERRQWTLQRMVVSPTPRSYILTGNLAGVFMSVLLQLTLLIVALTLIGSLLQGQLDLIWGDNPGLIATVIVAVALAVSGFGMLMAGIAKTPEQGQILAPITSMAMGVLGGAFGFTLPRAASAISMVYWGREAFQKLAGGEADIGLNLAVLVVQAVVMYIVGVWLFNRRFEVA